MRPYQPRQIVCEVCGRSCNAARDASRHLPPVPAQGAERSLHPLQPDDSSSSPPNGAMPRLAYVSHLDWKGYARTALEPGLSSIKRPNSASSAMIMLLFWGQLRKYIANFATPSPYNNVLFDILAAALDWAFLANAATE
jgi:hypothetical protein